MIPNWTGLRWLAVVAILVLSPATVSTAATKFWKISVGSDTWSNGNNWSNVSAAGVDDGGAPGILDTVRISPTDGAARTITYDAVSSLTHLEVDLTGAGAATTTFSMPANNLTAKSEYIGYNGRGVVNHSGGTNNIAGSGGGLDFLDVGVFAAAVGTYNLSGTGAVVSNNSEYIGDLGTGFFNQTGGTNTINGAGHHLYLGYNSGAAGTYTISGGSLRVNSGDIVVGNSGAGSLQIGAQASVYAANNLHVNSASTVNLNGGTLRFNTVSGLNRLNYTAGTIQLAGNRTIGDFIGGDTTISGLFGAFVTPGKILAVEGDTTIEDELYVHGGKFTSPQITVNSGSGVGDSTLFSVAGGGTVTCNNADIGEIFTGGTNILEVDGAGSSWTITGTLELGSFGESENTLTISNQALLNVNTLRIFDNSIVRLNGGTLRLREYLHSSGGSFDFQGGTIQFIDSVDIGVNFSTGANIREAFGVSPTITSQKNLTIEGTATLHTKVTLDGGTFSVGQLVNGHNLQFQRGTLNITNQAVMIGSAGPLGNTLEVDDDMAVNVTLGITNQGLVTGDGEIGGTFANAAAGELRADPGKSLTLTGSGNANAGRIRLLGGALDFEADLTNNAGAFISGNGSLITGGLTNNGTMNFAGTANIIGDVINSAGGKIISGGGGATIFYDDVTNDGEIRTSTNGFTVFFGAVDGAGAFTGTGTVNFEGDLSPGNSPAVVQFAGDVTLGPEATLQIELGGPLSGQYDQIQVAGELTLDGALELSLINGFTPSAGQSFDILNWGSVTGAFSSVQLPSLAGFQWDISQLSAGVLSVAPAFTADFDHDTDVDAADLAQWTGDFGLNGESDADGDGDSDGDDFLAWQRQLGSVPAVTAAAVVPEPGAFLLFILAAADFRRITGRKRQELVNE